MNGSENAPKGTIRTNSGIPIHKAKGVSPVWDVVKNQKIPMFGNFDAVHMPGSPNPISIGELVEEPAKVAGPRELAVQAPQTTQSGFHVRKPTPRCLLARSRWRSS